MPRILFTNLFLASRTGSELHTLTLAKLFRRAGWEVTCFTLLQGYPLQPEFETAGIKVLTLGQEAELLDNYDVFYAQHRLVSEHVWNIPGITFGKVIVSILGIVTDEELPPCFYGEADGFVFVSEESRDSTLASHQLTVPNMVFPNYAESEYFTASSNASTALRRIAVLSNHPPKEVLDLVGVGSQHNVSVDVYGYETRSVEVTPELLSHYDVVISIGRSVQLCLAAGVPIYCYDQFGGPGFITPNNLDKHAHNNFSGRSEPVKRTAEELYEDIVGGYSSAIANSDTLRQLAKDRYELGPLFSGLTSFIQELIPSQTGHERPAASYAAIARDFAGCSQFVDAAAQSYGLAQLYYQNEGGVLSEGTSRKLHYRYGSVVNLELLPFPGTSRLPVRFDPDIKPCVCRIMNDGQCHALNSLVSIEQGDVFTTIDPQYNIDVIHANRTLSFCVQPIDEDSLREAASALARQSRPSLPALGRRLLRPQFSR